MSAAFFTDQAIDLRKLRLSAELRQADVATALGVSRQLVSAWEWGHARPTREQLVRLVELLYRRERGGAPGPARARCFA